MHIHGVLKGRVRLQTMGSCRQESIEESGHSVHGRQDNRRLETTKSDKKMQREKYANLTRSCNEKSMST